MKVNLTPDKILFLKHQALNLRVDSIRATTQAGSGHPTSCLSIADIVSVIFFNFLRYDINNSQNPDNDRFILSKGHAIPVVYAAWKLLGVINDSVLMSLRKFGSALEGHPTPRFSFNEAATGSLGQGLSIGVGMALCAKIDKRDYTTYVLMGDGEIAEGSVWEAAEFASYHKIDNLIGIVDCNGLGQSGKTMHDHDVKNLVAKFESFGWHTLAVDGHDVEQVFMAIQEAHQTKNRPTVIIAKTFKGYGVFDIEDKMDWHGKIISRENVENFIQKMKLRFKEESDCKLEYKYVIPMPTRTKEQVLEPVISIDIAKDKNIDLFVLGKKMSTRKAYGYALAAIGKSESVVVLDCDVKNSTFSEIFGKTFEDRFIECFIAEQNMVGIATGLQARGKLVFAATFGAFLTRAFDQIRMAGIGKSVLRLCGSHCGVSIGQDGPSQMALEDIAMFNSIPNSVILYPSDGVATYKLLELSANYNGGISYIRTTRADTQIIYGVDEKFELGGCKILRKSSQDVCCIIAAGITVHEALAAYERLKENNVLVSVIDLYSVKPFDMKTVLNVAKDSKNRILTVEDHYLTGGIGQIIASSLINFDVQLHMLGLDHISMSGSTEELMRDAKIDSESIMDFILELVQV